MHLLDYVVCHFDRCLAVAEEHSHLLPVIEAHGRLVVMEELGRPAAEDSKNYYHYILLLQIPVYCIAKVTNYL